jgi:CHASE3 domain sensor protein
MELSYHRRVASYLFLIAIILLTFCGSVSYKLYDQDYNSNNEVARDYQTIRVANQFLLAMDRASNAVTLLLLTGNQEIISNLPSLIISAKLHAATLRQLIDDDKTELDLYTKLQPLIIMKIDFLEKAVREYTTGHQAAAIKLAADNYKLLLGDEVTTLTLAIKHIEISQLEAAIPTYILKKYNADRFFIVAGLLNIFYLIFIYAYVRLYA